MDKIFKKLLNFLSKKQLFQLNHKFNKVIMNEFFKKDDLIILLNDTYFNLEPKLQSQLICQIAEYLGHYDLSYNKSEELKAI